MGIDNARARRIAAAPVFDALRLAVQFRSNRDELGVLSALSGISKAKLERFADTGEIDERDRTVLEVLQ